MERSGVTWSEGLIKNAILIAGPTASGKSTMALELAERHGGVIVNTDSMQVYSVLDVLTARPTKADHARAPHELYGHVHPSRAYSTGAWLRDVGELTKSGAFDGRTPIFAGGTGLYFRALLEGIAAMPKIPSQLRETLRSELALSGPDPLHRVLRRKDPAAAQIIRANDGQRIVRALEVLEASGRSILSWQNDRGSPLIEKSSAQLFVIQPERVEIHERINARFDWMMANGVLGEVKALAALNLDPSLPAAKAIGVRELSTALAGQIAMGEAVERAKIATRQYAKRQVTWFRNQFGPEWTIVSGPD